MSIDGIWTSEIYGPFGWENRGVFLLEQGRIIGGDNRMYAVGSYRMTGTTVDAELKIHYYGPPRTVFGEATEQFISAISGTVKENEIDGTISRPDRPQFELQIRLTKRLELPTG